MKILANTIRKHAAFLAAGLLAASQAHAATADQLAAWNGWVLINNGDAQITNSSQVTGICVVYVDRADGWGTYIVIGDRAYGQGGDAHYSEIFYGGDWVHYTVNTNTGGQGDYETDEFFLAPGNYFLTPSLGNIISFAGVNGTQGDGINAIGQFSITGQSTGWIRPMGNPNPFAFSRPPEAPQPMSLFGADAIPASITGFGQYMGNYRTYKDSARNRYIFAMEDGGDNDYNDIIIAVDVGSANLGAAVENWSWVNYTKNYSAWSAWTPDPATVPSGQSFQQSRTQTYEEWHKEVSDLGNERSDSFVQMLTNTEYQNVLGTMVVLQNQSITFTNPGTKTYGDAAFSLSASATSGLPVSFSLIAGGGVVNLSGSTVTITGAGGVTIRASQSGDGSYNAAPDVDVSFTVNTIAVTFVFGNLVHTYDGATKTATVTPTPGGASISTDLTRGPNASSYTVTATANYPYSGSSSATLTISPTNQTALSASGTPDPLPFGNTATLTASGGTGPGAISFTQVSGTGTVGGNSLTATGSTGTVVFYATRAASTNYNAISSPNTSIALTRRNITVTAPSGSKIYDGADVALGNPTVTSGTLRVGDTISFTGNTTAIAASVGVTPTVVGSTIIRDSGSIDVTAHYNITPASGSFTISIANQAALTASASPSSIQFGDSSTLSTTGGSSGGSVTYALVSGPASITGNTLTAISAPGTALFTATMVGNANYNAVTSNQTSVTITRRAITITAPSGSKTWDGSGVALGNPTLTAGSLRAGDTISFTGNTTAVAATPGVTIINTGVAVIRDSGSADVTAYYNVTSNNGSYTVLATPANLTITGSTDFGSARVGTGSPQFIRQTFTLQNSGQTPMNVTAINFTGDYSLVQVNGGAPSLPFVIPGLSSATITVEFRPIAGGPRNGSMTIQNTSSNAPNANLALTGNGIPGSLSITWGPIR